MQNLFVLLWLYPLVTSADQDATCEADGVDQSICDRTTLLQVGLNVKQDRSVLPGHSQKMPGESYAEPEDLEEERTHQYVLPSPEVGLKGVFDDIANKNFWRTDESVSGPGSKLATTAPVRQCLGQWIHKYNIKTFVDAACGDANWQAHIPGLENVKYKGYDIADKPVQTAREKNSRHTSMSFDQMDVTREVPHEKADLIMVRDVIQHLPLHTGRQMLLNAKESGARYLAVSTFSDGMNQNIRAGEFYKNDVHASPFGLPGALESCDNYDRSQPEQDLPGCHLILIDLSAWNPSD